MNTDTFNETLATNLLNKLIQLLNETKHKEAEAVIQEFDQQLNGKKLTFNCIYYRIKLGAELLARQGKYNECCELIERHRLLFQGHSKEWYELLIRKGESERLSHLHFSVTALSEALALAEELGDPSLIAQAYSYIGIMFAMRYPALGIYFSRKAETYYLYQRDDHHLNLERVKRAKSSYHLYQRDPQEKHQVLLEEAQRLIDTIDTSHFNRFELNFYNSTKGEILQDEKIILTLIQYYEEIEALPELCRLEEIYLEICMNKGQNQDALDRLPFYKQHIAQRHGQQVLPQLKQLEESLKSGKRVNFEHPFETRHPNEPTTLFDILEHLSLGEELWALNKSILRSCFPTHLQEDKFDAIQMPDGTTRLFPCSLSFNDYYRGQSTYYEECRPSLYRKNMTPAKRFVERLKYEEFKLLIHDHPMINIFANEIATIMPDGTEIPLSLSVDTLALAQHYGILTELMDLTCDKFVAAFFACTRYENGTYVPITDSNAFGVYYHYVDLNIPFPNMPSSRLRAVGLQPFSRPGEQRGFVLEMQEDQDFNNLVQQAIHFRHHPLVSQFIFNYTNRSRKLFPYDPLQDKAAIITKSHQFSEAAYEAAQSGFYPNESNATLQSYLKEESITLVSSPITTFTFEEKQQIRKRWEEQEKAKTFAQIIVRPTYMGPIQEVSPNEIERT